MLSGAHGAVSHCHDNNHEHLEHGHDHEGDDISFLHSVTHEIIHSVAHLIEHSAYDHDCCDIALLIEVDNVKTASTPYVGLTIIWKPKSKNLSSKKKCQPHYIAEHYKEIFYSLTSLRGPPSIV